MVRLDPGAEKRPDEESVVKDKHNTLLGNGNGRINGNTGKTTNTKPQILTQETNAHSTQFKLQHRKTENTHLFNHNE